MLDFLFEVPADLTNSKEWQGMLHVIRTLHDAGYQAFLVGGAVRDILLGRKNKDLDITTSATPEQVLALFDKAVTIGASFGVVTVVIDGCPYEVATFREEREYMDGRHPERVSYTDSPKIDVERRDFTINALLYDVITGKVIDYVGGVEDLKHGVLRTVGEADLRFAEDHLRILRAVRFASRFGFKMAPATRDAAVRLAETVNTVSAERIRDELEKMLMDRNREYAFRMLADTGLLKIVLPEIDVMRGVEQPPQFHPEGDVFEHTMLMLSHIAYPTEKVVWSILLHDVGKPVTRTVNEAGIAHFYGHESVGADMAERILRRLRVQNDVLESVVAAVRNHMRFAAVAKMRPATWKRIVYDKNFPIELELHRIDCLSCHGFMDNYVLLLDRVNQLARESENTSAMPTPLVKGDDLLKIGYKPGKLLGNVLREIQDLQLDGQINDVESALDYAREHLTQQ